jgi:Zn-dependent protease with chaperone function
MQFREHQRQARHQTLHLIAWFAVLLVGLTLAVNLLLAGLFKLVLPFSNGFPALFFETNTAVVLLFVIGGTLVETHRLRDGGGPRVARWLGGTPVTDDSQLAERRLLNVIDEMATASGQPLPQVFVLRREDAINAFVAGWAREDLVICVTQGALDRLTRAELQGLVAHEFGHIKHEDLNLMMRLLAMVWGLALVHGYGRAMMSPNSDGRVHPGAWLVGCVFAGVGWLGWMAGRMLQSAVSRQREFLADASAIQFTRTRDGLGNVLRKLWHDEQTLASRMRAPAADMIASLLLHEPRHRYFSSHPPLQERIERICGAVLAPLPAPLVRDQSPERPRPPMLQDLAEHGALAAQAPAAMPPASRRDKASAGRPARRAPRRIEEIPLSSLPPSYLDSQPPDSRPAMPSGFPPDIASTPQDPLRRAELHGRQRFEADREALSRLLGFVGPTERRLIVLALMMDRCNAQERRLWKEMAAGMSHADMILECVAHLLPTRRLPEFERLTTSIAQEPIEQRRAMVEGARALLKVDGRVSPQERLWWLALRHRMASPHARPTMMRPISGQGQRLDELEIDQRSHVGAMTAYLARFVPLQASDDGQNPTGQAWYKAVMQRCGTAVSTPMAKSPDADELVHALSGIQELSWVVRPILLRAWVEEAINHSPTGMLTDDTADALRLSAMLIDAPMPPMLASHYPKG